MRKELLNTQIEALNAEHGAQIVDFYKSHGFDTKNCLGTSINSFYYVCENGKFSWTKNENPTRKTITLEQAKQLVDTKDFSKMDLEEWIEETEKLKLNKDELYNRINRSEFSSIEVYAELNKMFNNGNKYSVSIVTDGLFTKWNTPKSDLYTEITAYKLQSGIIVETKEQAEILSKEIKIRLDLSEIVAEDYVDIIMKNLETIKQIINQ